MSELGQAVISRQQRWAGCLAKLGKVALAALCLLILTAFASPVVLELPFHLLLGWALYLREVIPRVQLNAELLICSIVALAFGCWGLHRLMPLLLGGKSWRFRWSLAWCALLVVLFATSIAATGIVHQAAWLFRTDRWIEMRGMSVSARSRGNAMQVRVALRLYAEEHGGRFPSSLRELLKSDVLSDERVFFCRHEDGGTEPWCYAGKDLADSGPGDLLILWEPRHNREGRRIVVFLDGRIDSINEDQFQTALERLHKHQSK